MRTCEVCGHSAEDDYIYCPKCGNRLDGKKLCPRCAKPIPKDAAVCPYCGIRLDGKFCCTSCGKLLEKGTLYCTACGKPTAYAAPVGARPAVAAVPGAAAHVAPAGVSYPTAVPGAAVAGGKALTRDRLFQILTVSFCLAALFVMALCSFFSLYSYSVTASGVGVGKSYGAFYYLVDQWNEIKLLVEGGAGSSSFLYSDGFYVVGTLSAVAVGINMIVSLVMLILGAVDGVRVLTGKKNRTRIVGFAATAFAPWVLLCMVLSSCGGSAVTGVLKVAEGVAGITSGLGAGTICALVFGAVLLFAALVLRFVQNGLNRKKIPILAICGTAGILVLTAIFGALFSSMAVKETSMNLGVALLTMCESVLCVEGVTSEMMAYAVVLVVLFFAAAVVCGVLVYQAIERLFDEKKENCNFLWQGIVLFALGILLCVFMSLLINAPDRDGNIIAQQNGELSAQMIAGAVFGGMLFAATLVFFILCRPKPAVPANAYAPIPAEGYWAAQQQPMVFPPVGEEGLPTVGTESVPPVETGSVPLVEEEKKSE